MATSRTTANVLTAEQLGEMIGLIKESDSVELKTSVPEVAHRSTITALGLDPMDAQIRQVFFFETPDLALDKLGVVARARRIQGKGGDSIVKLRPCVPNELPADVRHSAAFRVEVDAMPGGFVCSGTMKGSPAQEDVKAVAAGGKSIRSLFSKEQRAYYAAHVPGGPALEDLRVLGPIFVLKGRIFPEEVGRRVVAEMWLYPSGSRILELSTRCETNEAFQVAAEMRAFLHARGVDISGEQETKTRKALDYFAKALK
jgi:hypothetical protein